MDKNWICVYRSSLLHNVELMRSILQERNLEAIVVNKQDSFYPTIGEIELFVRRDSFIAAKNIVEQAGL
jgi:hypothetical protein